MTIREGFIDEAFYFILFFFFFENLHVWIKQSWGEEKNEYTSNTLYQCMDQEYCCWCDNELHFFLSKKQKQKKKNTQYEVLEIGYRVSVTADKQLNLIMAKQKPKKEKKIKHEKKEEDKKMNKIPC